MSIIQEHVVLVGILDDAGTITAIQTNTVFLNEGDYSGTWVLNNVVDTDGNSYVDCFAIVGSAQIGHLAVVMNGPSSTNLLNAWKNLATLTAHLTVNGHATSTQIHLCTLPVLDLLLFEGGATAELQLTGNLSTAWFSAAAWSVAVAPATGTLSITVPVGGDGLTANVSSSGPWSASEPWGLLLSVTSLTGYTSHARFDGWNKVLRITATGALALSVAADPTSVIPFKRNAADATVYRTEVVSGSGMTQPHLYLRRLQTASGTPLTGYTWFRGQQSGGTAINAALPSASAVAQMTLTVPGGTSETVTLDTNLTLPGAPPASVDWTSGGGDVAGVTATVTWGNRPVATTPPFNVHFREFLHTTDYSLAVPNNTGTCTLSVASPGATDSWNYQDLQKLDADPLHTLVLPSSSEPLVSSTGLPLIFPLLLTAPATADLTVTIQRADNAHPESVALMNFTQGAVVDSQAPTAEILQSISAGDVPLPTGVAAVEGGTHPFAIRLTDNVGLDTASITLSVTLTSRYGGLTTTSTYSVSSGTWSGATLPTGFAVLDTSFSGGNNLTGTIAGTLDLSAKYSRIKLKLAGTDLKGVPFDPTLSVREIDLWQKTHVALVLDYSGSMRSTADNLTGQTKWGAVKDAANLFSTLFGELWPTVSAQPGAAANTLRLSTFHWDNGTNSLKIGPVTPVDFVTPPASAVALAEPPGSNCTPIGDALLDAKASFVSAGYAASGSDRHIVLLTDGMNNRGTTDVPGIVHALIPSVTDLTHPELGYRIHTISYGPTGATSDADLVALSNRYGSRHYSTETSAVPNSANSLQELFLSIFADAAPAELVSPTGGSYAVEDGVSRVAFVAIGGPADALVIQRDGVVTAATTGTSGGVRYAVVDNPAAGDWIITNAGAGAQTLAVVDLELRTRFDVQGGKAGEPLTLLAEISQGGRPVSDATVTATLTAPGESVGEVMTQYARRGGVVSGHTKATPQVHSPRVLSTRLVVNRKSTPLVLPNAAAKVEPKSPRLQLLQAALEERGEPLKLASSQLVLYPAGQPGRYRAVVTNTALDGVYKVRFEASGETSKGHAFRRQRVLTEYVEPKLSTSATDVTWIQKPQHNGQVVWQGTITPVTQSGKPLGPSLADRIQVLSGVTQGTGKVLPVTDHLDGTYSTTLTLPQGQRPPSVHLGLSSARPSRTRGDTLRPIHSLRKGRTHVRVILTAVLPKTVKEWNPKDTTGEIAIETAVSINNNDHRAQRHRFPETGTVKVKTDAKLELNEVIFDATLADGEGLDIALGATEFDRIRFLELKDSYAGYRRVFRGPCKAWAGEYAPGDEKQDPEDLRDWEVWYRIEVL